MKVCSKVLKALFAIIQLLKSQNIDQVESFERNFVKIIQKFNLNSLTIASSVCFQSDKSAASGLGLWKWRLYLLRALGIEIQFYIKIPRQAMIYLQESLQPPSSLQKSVETLLKELLQRFLFFMQEKKVRYSVLPKQTLNNCTALSMQLYIDLQGRETEAFCQIKTRCSQSEKVLNFSIEFKVTDLGGKSLADYPHRTRIQLLSAIGSINKYLRQQHSSLTLTADHSDSLIFSSRINIVTSEKRGAIKEAVSTSMHRSLVQFLKYMGQLSELDVLGSVCKLKEYQSLGQLLEQLYAKKLKKMGKTSQKQAKSMKSCLSFLFRSANKQNQCINKIKQANQYIVNYMNIQQEKNEEETIATGISIVKNQRPTANEQNKLISNLSINQAVLTNDGAITLRKVTFQKRKSFGSLRAKTHEAEIVQYFSDQYKQSLKYHEQHLILKRCPTAIRVQTNLTQGSYNISEETVQSCHIKSQAQSGHENEHNFLMVNGNLKSPYIGKYYLDIAEGKIDAITKRTIMTQFERGDLFTEVAYAQHHRLHQFYFYQYLTIFEQLAQAIAFLHENKVLHRDIKPTNILFQYHSRNRMLCKLIDFGSCYILRESEKHLFNSKMFTTPNFNLTYRQARKITGNAICQDFSQESYETHQLLDIFGIAQTVSFLLNNSPHRSECLQTIIQICKSPNPNYRFTPQQLITVIRHIRLNHCFGGYLQFEF